MGSEVRRVVSIQEVFVVHAEQQAGEEEVLFLSNIDQRFGYYVRDLYFFPNGPGLDVILDKLKAGLSKVLSVYPAWSGRLRVSDKNRLEILCNNKGAMLGSGVSQLAISEVTNEDFDDFFLAPPDDLKSLDDLPLLNIQVTQMACGGYAISMLNSHTLAEATSAIYFLMNLANLCRGEELLFIPYSDPTVFKARDPPQVKFEHLEFGKQGKDSRYTVTPESVLKAESHRKSIAASSTKQRRAYNFSRERLALVKQAATSDELKCSTFEALAALVWRSHAAALVGETSSSSSSDAPRVVKMRFLVDTRSMFKLGVEFCGNAVYVPTVCAEAEVLLSETLSDTAQRVRHGKESITEEYVRSGLDFLELHPDYWYHPDCDTVINSWPRAMSLSKELDFGWGKPCRVEYPMHPGNKSIIFFPFSEKDGVDVSVSLEPEQFSRFEAMLGSH